MVILSPYAMQSVFVTFVIEHQHIDVPALLGLWVVTFVIEHQHIDVPALLWIMGCHICYRAPTYRCSCSTLACGLSHLL